MNYTEFKRVKKKLEQLTNIAECALKRFPVQPSGLVSEEIRNSEMYIKTNRMFKVNFKKLQDLAKNNKKFTRKLYLENKKY